jgi:hypothetical protein
MDPSLAQALAEQLRGVVRQEVEGAVNLILENQVGHWVLQSDVDRDCTLTCGVERYSCSCTQWEPVLGRSQQAAEL